MKNDIKKLREISVFRSLKIYHKFLGCFSKFQPVTNKVNFENFDIKFGSGLMELPSLHVNKLNPTYALIKSLDFHPEIKLNKMQNFKSLLKWKELNLSYAVLFRDYPLGFSPQVKTFNKPSLALKLPPKVLSVEKSDLHLSKKLRINEEIVRVLPYVRKADKNKLVQVPIIKRPLHKSSFSREEMKSFREKIAQQNTTSWVNIQIFEIYDKFHVNLYSGIRQKSGTKDLECHFNIQAQHKNPEKNYYLLVGQRRDTNEQIKAIVDSSDLKTEKSN